MMEATLMGSFKRNRVFDPLDLEIIDRVYEAAWAQVEARETILDEQRNRERQEGLRKLVFAVAGTTPPGLGNHVDFDNLCEAVFENIAKAA
jgi:hypothetical protein